MEIFPLGHASFKLRGKLATVVTDPYDEKVVGIKFPKHTEADILTISHNHADHNAKISVGGNPFVVEGAGEYEIKGISIIGVSSFHDETNGADRGKNTMYRIEIDGIRVLHLGDLGHVLSSAQVDVVDGIDVLFIPVGGVYTIDAEKAAQVISDLEPRIVIPMHYGTDTYNKNLAPVSVFLKHMGKESVVPVPKLTVSRDKLPAEMQVVVLE